MATFRSFDYATALRYCRSPETLVRVARKFVEILEQDLPALRESAEARRSDDVAAVAHRIKGTSATLAAHEINSIAVEIERIAKADELDGMRTGVDKLTTAVDLYRSDVTALEAD
jgi:HPt (histidine-containing phosphotransfer) domain-containing protein